MYEIKEINNDGEISSRTDIHKKIIKHYGDRHKIKKCREELRELSDELLKLMEGRGSIENLTSEMADVLNTLEQQCIIHIISPLEIAKEQNRKMMRQLKRIEDEAIN